MANQNWFRDLKDWNEANTLKLTAEFIVTTLMQIFLILHKNQHCIIFRNLAH